MSFTIENGRIIKRDSEGEDEYRRSGRGVFRNGTSGRDPYTILFATSVRTKG